MSAGKWDAIVGPASLQKTYAFPEWVQPYPTIEEGKQFCSIAELPLFPQSLFHD
jgi:hypothetical protein